MTALDPHSFRILCIEDEPEILRDLVDELEDYGFRVDQATSADAALPIIVEDAPDLIVCDMQMPGMSGLALLEQLRGRDDDAASVPFVFLTAFGDRANAIAGRRAGADDYLVKPVDYDLLIAAVESHLHNAAHRAERVAHAHPRVQDAPRSGRDDVLQRLEQRPAGTLIAVAKIDNLAEVTLRFGNHETRSGRELARRLARMAGIELYWLNRHCCVAMGDDPVRLSAALDRMVNFRMRDHSARGQSSARVAMSIVTGQAVPGEDPATLIDRLVEAARLVQRDGGGRILAIDGPEHCEIQLANAIRSELINAIRQGQMHVCYQPKVRAGDGCPVAAEVLVRWDSPLLGQLAPGTFIPVVERAGLLPHLTDWVLHQAAAAQVRLAAEGLPARLAVNIGASEFGEDLAERIGRIFAEHGADVGLIEVEITESSLLTDAAAANDIVRTLHALGIAVALDDFGTGYSSLSHLQSCAVDTIKIDRSFVQRVAETGPDQKIVLGIIGLAKMLEVETVAEGVELESQRDWLTEHSCTTLQGYLISRPLRFDNYLGFLQNWMRTNAAQSDRADQPTAPEGPER